MSECREESMMSWLLRLVPPRRHQRVDEVPEVTEDEAVAMVRRAFGPDVIEVTATAEANWPHAAA